MSILLNNAPPQGKAQQPTIAAQRDPGDGDKYSIGQMWINVTSDEIFTLTSFTDGLPNWSSAMSGGSTFTSILVTPGPSEFEGVFEVLGDVNQAEVIKITENAVGGLGTITIESLAGTDPESINIHSVSGGINIETDGASGDIGLFSNAGSISLQAVEDVADNILIQTGGGVSASMSINNATGVDSSNNIATAAIHIIADLGGVGIQGDDFAIYGEQNSIIEVNTGDLVLLADTGDINIEAAVGDINIDATTGSINFTTGTDVTYTTSGGIDLTAATASAFTVTDAGEDLTLQSLLGKARLFGGEVAADAVTVDSLGGFTIDGVLGSFITVTGAAQDITVGSVGGSVNLIATEASALAISLQASDAAGGIDVDSGTGGVTVDTTGAFSIDGAAASNVTTTGAGIDLTLSSSLGSVIVTASEAAVNAVQITASDVAGGLDLNAGTGGVTVDTTGSFSIDGAAASNITLTGAFDLTVNSTAGSIIVTGGQAAVDAIDINASDVAGGIDVDSGTGGVTVDTTGAMSFDSAAASNMTVTGAFDLTVSSTAGSVVISGGEAAVDAVTITAGNAAGGLDLNAGTGGVTVDTTASISLDCATASNFTITGAADLTLSSTAGSTIINGGEAAADAIQFVSGGGMTATLTGADFVVTGGNIEIATAASGVILGSGLRVVDGAGSPDTVVTAAKGSLYLRTNGSGVNDRAYINTDGATAWTALVTVS